MSPILFLHPEDPPDRFPDPGDEATDPDGLVAIGGDLAPARLLAAYRRGIFPWYEAGQPILWWSPDPRAVLRPEELRVTRSLRRTLRSDRFRTSVDQAFERVVRACAATRAATGTWLTPEMQAAYVRLHELGHAHAVETWQGDELVGGLYGVTLGGMFFGESMFSIATDASKVALAHLASLAPGHGIEVIDCQVATDHLDSLGSRHLPRSEFLGEVARLTARAVPALAWPAAPAPTAPLGTAGTAPGRLRG